MKQQVIDNHSTAIQVLESLKSSEHEILKAGFFLVQNNHYDYFPQVLEKLEPLGGVFGENLEWNYCMGYACVTNHRPEQSVVFLSRLLPNLVNNPLIYTALAWAYLQLSNWSQAFLVSSAGLNNCEQKGGLAGLQVLSQLRLMGRDSVSFEKAGKQFQFNLSTSNTQEIEASLHHLSQKFTEWDELQMLSRHLDKIDSIVEVGCLVGNHSVYFLKQFSPTNLTIIDASQTSLEHTKNNLELNMSAVDSCRVKYIHSAIGSETGTVTFFENEVPLNPIDHLLKDRADFLKIDVDGMEIQALEGARSFIQEHQPKIMIEVLHVLKQPFETFLKSVDYRVLDQVDHVDYSNYLIVGSGI